MIPVDCFTSHGIPSLLTPTAVKGGVQEGRGTSYYHATISAELASTTAATQNFDRNISHHQLQLVRPDVGSPVCCLMFVYFEKIIYGK